MKNASRNRKQAQQSPLVQYTNIHYHNTCIYCGCPSTCNDHVPPLSRIDDYMALQPNRPVFLLVPACTRCNSKLSDSLQRSLIERIDNLKDLLQRQLARKGKTAVWSDKELNDLGPNLRSMIGAHMVIDNELQQSIDFECDWNFILEQIEGL